MKKLAGCAIQVSCPAVYDPEDGSGDLVVIGECIGFRPMQAEAARDAGISIGDREQAVVISAALLKQALSSESV